VKLGDYEKTRRFAVNGRYTINASVCTQCGIIRIYGHDDPIMDGFDSGFAYRNFRDLNWEEIVDEMVLPGSHSEERMIFISKDEIVTRELDDLSKGITTDWFHYDRLVYFLGMEQDRRRIMFGACTCPVASLSDEGYILHDGRRRASILFELGAPTIPVATVGG
jgi:hypothetical protein